MHYKPAMSEPSRWGTAPTLDDIAAMARKALDSLDEPFRTHAKAVAIKVEDFADEETLEAMKIDNPYELTGLYSGVALTLELQSAPSQIPPMVWLYRIPILLYWAEHDETLGAIVTHVLVHEIGHHFGFDDDDMDAIEKAAG